MVTRNQFVGLKVVNGAPFKAVDIFPDLASGTIALASDATLYLGPPAAVLLQSDDIADLAIPGLPVGTILLKSKTVAIPEAMRGKGPRSRGKPGFRWVTHRTGPLCTPATGFSGIFMTKRRRKNRSVLSCAVAFSPKGTFRNFTS